MTPRGSVWGVVGLWAVDGVREEREDVLLQALLAVVPEYVRDCADVGVRSVEWPAVSLPLHQLR